MDKLPNEVIERIVGHLPNKPLAQYATISRRWQKPVEKRTFETIKIKSTPEDWSSFFRYIIVRPQTRYRIQYLRTIMYTVVMLSGQTILPSQRGTLNPLTQTLYPSTGRGDYLELDHEVTAHIKKVFDLLEYCDQYRASEGRQSGGLGGLTLELGWVLTSIPKQLMREPLHGSFKITTTLGDDQISFPKIQCVSKLVLHTFDTINKDTRSLAPVAALELLPFLPSLKRLEIVSGAVFDYRTRIQQWEVNRHVMNRNDFVAKLSQVGFNPLLSCSEVSLSLEKDVGYDFANRPYPVFYCPFGYEQLSQAMRLWSYNLISMDLSGLFSSSLFWPKAFEPRLSLASHAVAWPRLKNLHVKFLQMTPAGGWYFTRQFIPGTEPKSYRTIPRANELEPLLKAWARALAHMPALEQATIRWSLNPITELPRHQEAWEPLHPESEERVPPRDWLVGFQAPGTMLNPERHPWEANVSDDLRNRPRLTFQNDNHWRPHAWIMLQLGAVAKKKFPNDDMVMLQVDEEGKVTEI